MADFRTFLDFEAVANADWTKNIDIAKLKEASELLGKIKKYADSVFTSKNVDSLSFDNAIKKLETLDKNIEAVDRRYQELIASEAKFSQLSKSSTGRSADDYANMAKSAKSTAEKLQSLKTSYKSARELFWESSGEAGKAWTAHLKKSNPQAWSMPQDTPAKEEPPVSETQAPIEQMNELAEASNKAREAVIDVGKAEESTTPAPIENQKEAMDRLAESATRCAETVKEAATANASASMTGGGEYQTFGDAIAKINSQYGIDKLNEFENVLEDIEASHSSGIDITLSTSEIEQAIPELEEMLNYLEQVSAVAKDGISFGNANGEDTSGLQAILNEYEYAYNLIREAHAELSALRGETQQQATEQTAQAETIKSVEKLAQKPAEKVDTSAPKMTSEYGALSSQYSEVQKNLEKLRELYKDLDDERKSMRENGLSGFDDSVRYEQLGTQMREIKAEFADTMQVSRQLEKEMARLEKGGFGVAWTRNIKDIEAEITRLQEQLSKAKVDLISSENIDASLARIQALENGIAKLQSLKDKAEGKDAGPLQNAVSPKMAQQNMFHIGGETPEKNASVFSRAMDSIAHKSDAVIAGWNRISSAISPAISMAKGFVSVLGHIGSIGATIGKGMFNGLIAGIKGVMSLMNGVQNAFSQFGSTAKSALSTLGGLASRGFNAIRTGVSGAIGGLKNMASHMTRFTKSHAPNMLKSLQSIKSMLVRRLKRTFISSIFNQAKEALQQLAMQSEGFNTSMSNIKNSFSEVAGNFAVTLGNLIQIVAPIVTTVLGWINSIIQAINALFSLISGKGTMTVAKKKTDNYAKSLKSAGGSAKELNNQLYGFDEITRQDDNNGGGGGGSSPTKFEEKAIDSIIGGDLKKKLEEIINAFKSGEFRKAGQLIGNLIAEMAEKAEKKIKELRPVAAKWARNIAQVLNGIVDSDAIRNSYKAAGQAANLVLETIYSFLDEFEFDNLGRKIADAVKHSTIEWNLVGRTLATLVNSTWSFLKGLFANLPWKDIGSRIVLGLNTAFSEINWSDIKDALRDGINGLFTTLHTILSEVKWADTAKAISENLAQLVTEIDWVKIGQTFGLGFDTAIDILDEFFKSGALSSTIKGLGTTIESALNEIDFPHLGEVARTGCTEIAKGFGNLLTEIDFEDKATKIKAGIETFFDTEHGGAAFDSAIEALTGENKGINRIIAGFKKLVDLKEGIQFEEIAKTIGDKAGELLSNINWSSLTTSLFLGRIRLKSAFWKLVSEIPFSDIAKKIAEGVNNFFAPGDSGKSPLEEAAENASKGLNNILTAFTDFLKELDLTKVRQSIANAINQFIGNVQLDKIVADIGQFVIKAAGEFANLFDPQKGVDFPALGQKLVDGFNGIFVDSATGKIKKDTFKTLGENIGKAIGGILETLDQFLQVDSGAVIEAIATTLSSINWTELLKKVLVMIGDAALKLGEAIPQLLKGILNIIRSIDWLEVAKEVLGLIGKALWAAIEATGGIIKQFVDFLFQTGDFMEEKEIVSPEMVSALQEQAGDAGRKMVDSFTDSTKKAMDSFKDEFGVNANIFGTAWNPDEYEQQRTVLAQAAAAMALGFQEEYKQAMLESGLMTEDAYKELTAKTERMVCDAMEATDWTTVQMDWALMGITLTDSLAQAITGKGSEDIGAALALLGAGVSQDLIASFDIDQLNETLFGFMNSTGLSLKETVAFLQGETIDDIAAMGEHTATELGTALGKITPEALKQALVEGKVLVKEASDDMAKSATPDTQNIADGKEGGTKLGKGVESGTTTGLENGIKATANSAQKLVKEGILDTLAGKEEDVTKAAESLETKAQKAFSKLPDDVKPYANDMLNYMVTAMEEGNPTVVAAVDKVAKDIVEKVKSYLNSGTGAQIASSFLDGMSQGVALHRASMINFFREATRTARDVAQAYLSEANGESIGKNMMIGLINGLIAYSDLLVLIMATICNATVDTARAILGIASPSKVFAEIGKYTVEGMEQGIADNGHKAVDAISDVAQSIENEGAVEMTVQSMVDGLDIVEGKMARLADIFSGIAETITSMGNFELPAMAKGQVIPYRSRVEGGTAGFGGAESSVSQSDIEDAMYSALVRAMDNRADSQPIVINLDGRRLAEVVSRYQRQNVRSMGV